MSIQICGITNAILYAILTAFDAILLWSAGAIVAKRSLAILSGVDPNILHSKELAQALTTKKGRIASPSFH